MLENFTRNLEQSLEKSTDETLLAELCRNLLIEGFDPSIVLKMRSNIQNRITATKKSEKREQIEYFFKENLRNLIRTEKISESGIILFAGLQGVGKTTTLSKYAFYLRKKGLRVACIGADTFRAGAAEQLKQNLQSYRIPVFVENERDPVVLIKNGLREFADKYDVILIDTSGRSALDENLSTELRNIHKSIECATIIVLDSGSALAIKNEVDFFKEFSQNFILSKTDGAKKMGGALSAIATINGNILFIGTGEHMADLKPFTIQLPENKNMKNIEENIRANKIIIGDFKRMITMAESTPFYSMVKKIKVIIDSLSADELQSNGDLILNSESRLRRISRGCGISVDEIKNQLNNFGKIESVLRNFGGVDNLMKTFIK